MSIPLHTHAYRCTKRCAHEIPRNRAINISTHPVTHKPVYTWKHGQPPGGRAAPASALGIMSVHRQTWSGSTRSTYPLRSAQTDPSPKAVRGTESTNHVETPHRPTTPLTQQSMCSRVPPPRIPAHVHIQTQVPCIHRASQACSLAL